MKKLLTLLIATIGVIFSGYGQDVKSVSVQLSAKASTNSITLSWKAMTGATSYIVYRREATSSNSWTKKATITNMAITSYIDLDAKPDVIYEYYVNKLGGASGYGYTYAGIEVGAKHFSGDLQLVVDSMAYANMKVVIEDTLIPQLIGDGWHVRIYKTGKNATPKTVKAYLQNWYNSNKLTNPTVFILGHVPVPLSGNFTSGLNAPPDGHIPQHVGAWATDCYYADMNGTWTDNVTNTGATNGWGKNYPNDGKFDQHRIPDKTAELAVGRVDMYNLPGINSDEVYLLKNYIRKLQKFKSGEMDVPKKALIADRLKWFNGEAPGRTGWMNLPGLVGAENIVENTNYFPHNKAGNEYLFSQVTSTAGYTSISGIGSMTNFDDSFHCVFNSYFGSYFGDWYGKNNFLRGCLASETHSLTSIWNGRPSWYFHNLGMGGTWGEAARQSQSNAGKYFIFNNFVNGVQINLMGDPTLKMHTVKPASNLAGTLQNGDAEVSLTWTASTEPGVVGYYIYRSLTDDIYGDYVLANTTMFKGTTGVDKNPWRGDNHYMVRAVKLENSASGSYHNMSLGSFTTVKGAWGVNWYTGEDVLTLEKKVLVYPNPANGEFFIDVQDGASYSYSIKNALGASLLEGVSTGNQTRIDLNNHATGIYFVVITRGDESVVKKITLN